MYSNQSYCVGKRQFCHPINQKVDEKLKHKTQKIVEVNKGSCSIRGRNKSPIFYYVK